MGTVTVEMDSRSAGPDGVYRPGDTRECSESKAQSLVESGQAHYIDDEATDEAEEEQESEEGQEEEVIDEEESNESEEVLGVDELMEQDRVEQNGPYYILYDEDGEEVDSFHGRDALEGYLNE